MRSREARHTFQPLVLVLVLSLWTHTHAASLPSTTTRATIGGVCRDNSECDGSLICASVSDGNLEQCAGRVCACAPQFNNIVACSESSSCPDSDVCVRVLFGVGVCTPCAAVGSDSTLLGSRTCESNSGSLVDDNGVCVDARLLRPDADNRDGLPHVTRTVHPVVFATDRLARVLCDRNGACATPAHLVTLHGKPMSMKTYCANHADMGCEQRTIRVNSPAMRRGVRVATPTHGLLFTALSARFGTQAEELALSALVHAGF